MLGYCATVAQSVLRGVYSIRGGAHKAFICAFTTGQTPVVHDSVSPLPRLIEDDDENEYDSKILPNIPDLLQGISTLI